MNSFAKNTFLEKTTEVPTLGPKCITILLNGFRMTIVASVGVAATGT